MFEIATRFWLGVTAVGACALPHGGVSSQGAAAAPRSAVEAPALRAIRSYLEYRQLVVSRDAVVRACMPGAKELLGADSVVISPRQSSATIVSAPADCLRETQFPRPNEPALLDIERIEMNDSGANITSRVWLSATTSVTEAIVMRRVGEDWGVISLVYGRLIDSHPVPRDDRP
jgi:hypothetical protein